MEAITTSNRNVILCSDTNSRNTFWESNHTNRRGFKVGEFIVRNQLVVINGPSRTLTFSGPMGESWIDFNLASPTLFRCIVD